MEAQEEPGEKKPSQCASLPSSPGFLVKSERGQYQGGEHEPVRGDDQHWRIAELNKNRGGGDRYDSKGKKYMKTIHVN
jgi:hypothetical protein